MTTATSPQPDADASLLKKIAVLPAVEREAVLGRFGKAWGLSVEEMKVRILHDWRFVSRPKQRPPEWGWTFWFTLAGRGYGKTRTGAEWVKEVGEENPGCRIALVAPTLMDVRHTMVEGESGLLSILPDSALRGGTRSSGWNRGTVELFLANGTEIQGFSSEVPDRLRGPQHHFAWGDELSSWKDAKEGDKLETTYSNLKLSTRLGRAPKFCFTSTPKANKLTREILAVDPSMLAVSRGSSYENRDNLSEVWWNTVIAPYEGTRVGRQEIWAQVLDDVEGALWSLALIDELRIRNEDPHDVAKRLNRIVVGVDPNISSEEGSNAAGIVVAGADGKSALERHGYVLADRSVVRASPAAWATAAVDAYYEFEADRIIAEKNQGGEMVSHTIKTIDPTVPVKLVNASRGKRTRAEPIATLYGDPNPEEGKESKPGRIHHVGAFAELEDEQTTWTPEAESPDRMDAAVWALSELMLKPAGTMTTHVPKGRRIPTPAR